MDKWKVLETAILARLSQLEEQRQEIDKEMEELKKWYIKAEENMEDKQF